MITIMDLIGLKKLIEIEYNARLQRDYFNAVKKSLPWSIVVSLRDGKKYIRIDIEGAGKYMIDKSSGEIYGIKAYGVIHKRHNFGTLETINSYDWSGYNAIKKGGTI